MSQVVPKSRSRKVNGYVKAMLALEAVRRKRDARYERYVRAIDQKRDRLVVDVETRRRALTGGQQAEARWILGAIPTVNAFKDVMVRYEVPGRTTRMLAKGPSRPPLTDATAIATLAVAEPCPDEVRCGVVGASS
jgi:hypothetical protein